MDEKIFLKIFESDYELVGQMPWLAYPKYKEKQDQNLQVILDGAERSRVYYSNALEWSSSCMEISTIAARNVSNLIAKKEGRQDMIKKFTSHEKSFNKLLHKVCGFATILSLTIAVFSYFMKW